MLDTNIVSDFIRNPSGPVRDYLLRAGEGSSCVSIITAAELRFGALKVRSDRIHKQLEDLFGSIPVLRMEAPADTFYGTIRAGLERRGTPIGPTDLFIAAHALALDLTLVTANTREFSRVPGLRVENWLDDSRA